MKRVSCALLVTVTALTAPAAAQAAWTSARTLDPKPSGSRIDEPGTRIAINSSGDSVALWIGSSQRVRASSGDHSGKFGTTKTMGSGYRPTVAVNSKGGSVIAWSDHSVLRMRTRANAKQVFGSERAMLASGQSTAGDDDFPAIVALPDNSFVAVFENSYRNSSGYHVRLRTLTISSSGKPSKWTDLGPGSLARFNPVRVNKAGAVSVAMCCPSASVPQADVAVRAAGAKAFSAPIPLAAGVLNGASVAPDGHVAAGATIVTRRGDAVSLGKPFAVRADSATSPFGPALFAPQLSTLSFGGDVAYDPSNRLYLVWQQKNEPKAFSNAAPVYAAITHAGDTAFGSRMTLDSSDSVEPQLAVSNRGVVAAWARGNGKWGFVQFTGTDGQPVSASAPSGGPYKNHDYVSNRQLAAAGNYTALAWEDVNGSIRASIKKL